MINVVLAGAGAFGIKHLDGIERIDGVQVTGLVGRRQEPTAAVAAKRGIERVSTTLDEALSWPDVDAVILCTPTQMHADQAIACMEAGKHVEVEIPLADSLADAQRVVDAQKRSGNRPSFSDGKTSTRWASRAHGQIIFCGTTPHTPSICFSTRAANG